MFQCEKCYNREMHTWQRKTEVLPDSHWESPGKFAMWKGRYHMSHHTHRSNILERHMPWVKDLVIEARYKGDGSIRLHRKKIIKSHEWNIREQQTQKPRQRERETPKEIDMGDSTNSLNARDSVLGPIFCIYILPEFDPVFCFQSLIICNCFLLFERQSHILIVKNHG